MKKNYLGMLSLVVMLSACAKDDEKVKESENVAGLGGAVEITIFPTYNGASVWSRSDYADSAYVKFNTLDFPGVDPGLYDMKVASDHSDHVHVRGLKKGDYYFFVTAMDSTGKRLVGSAPFTLNSTDGIFHLPVALMPQ